MGVRREQWEFVYRALRQYLSCWGAWRAWPVVRPGSGEGDQVTYILSPLTLIMSQTFATSPQLLLYYFANILLSLKTRHFMSDQNWIIIHIFIVKFLFYISLERAAEYALVGTGTGNFLNWEDSKCMGEQVVEIWMEKNRKKTFGRQNVLIPSESLNNSIG